MCFHRNAVQRVQRGQELRQQEAEPLPIRYRYCHSSHTHILAVGRPLSDFTRFLLVQIHTKKILSIIQSDTRCVRDVRLLSTNVM